MSAAFTLNFEDPVDEIVMEFFCACQRLDEARVTLCLERAKVERAAEDVEQARRHKTAVLDRLETLALGERHGVVR